MFDSRCDHVLVILEGPPKTIRDNRLTLQGKLRIPGKPARLYSQSRISYTHLSSPRGKTERHPNAFIFSHFHTRAVSLFRTNIHRGCGQPLDPSTIAFPHSLGQVTSFSKK